MNYLDEYRRTFERLIDLGATLSAEQAATVVPATPEWTVTQVYAHLVGVIDDLATGRIEGAASDPWTAAQVERRADGTLADHLAEWRSLGESIDQVLPFLQQLGEVRPVIDVWTHEQDIRGALGVPGGRDDEQILLLANQVRAGAAARLGRHAGGEFAIRFPNEGQPEHEPWLIVEPYELIRGTLGRRSRRQLHQWDWKVDGDVDPHIDALLFFGIADHDIADV